MKKFHSTTNFLFIIILLSPFCSFSQNSLWTDLGIEAISPYINSKKQVLPENFRIIKLNRAMADQLQNRAPRENGGILNISASVLFDIPLPEGSNSSGAFTESAILSPFLAQLNPTIKTYRLTDAVTRNQLGRLTFTTTGISGLLFTKKGSIYLTPIGADFPYVHIVYYVRDVKTILPVLCGLKEDVANLQPAAPAAGDCQLRTFRLAIAATGEYTTWAGSQPNAIGYITTTVNNVTAIYERDAAIRFTLVTDNSILYTNPATDPYSTVASPTSTTLNQNQSALDLNILTANYDLGMVFNNAWNGGLASLAVVCNNSLKGRSASGLTFGTGANPVNGPQGPIFDVTVAHEIAHQFSATHSFAANNGTCGSNATAATAYEPGGGSTIMAYTNICSPNFYQDQSDNYFHTGNLSQILSYATSGSDSCATPMPILNTPPSITVPAASYTIPISTPFTLSSTGTDGDGNTLFYTWEQMDAGVLSSTAPLSTNTAGPNFRSYPPNISSSRTFPRINDIVAGVSPAYEVLSSVTRTMNFRVTVRDQAAGGGCTNEQNIAVTTNVAAGPFTVTSQSAPVTLTANGANTFSVTWNVANTNLAPVNCSAIDILFSIDGGFTYPYNLSTNTANDGTETIIIPNLPTSIGRVKVQSRNNIFFNINAANITIQSSCAAEASTYAPNGNVSANAGSVALDLTLNPVYGNIVSPSGTISSGDPASSLAVNNLAPGSCIQFSNVYRYDTYRFTPSVAGNYTFTRGGGTSPLLIFNLYNGDFDPSSACNNLILSSGTYDGAGVNIATSISATLTPGLYYTLAVGTFSSSSPALPSSYTYTVAPPPGGNIFDNTPSPGAGFNYTYVIVNNATGNITAIDPGANLSNNGTFPGGTNYTVYGLSYANSIPIGTINGYIGNSFTILNNDLLYNPISRCGNLSKNSIQVAVLLATPVTFLGLSATKINNDHVRLTWKTASEQNNDYFEIQRSVDGYNFSNNLGKVPGKGTGNEITQYTFTDVLPLQNWNFYRIKQVDLDGRSSYSNIASLQFSKPGSSLQVFPNPASSQITLEYNSISTGRVQLILLDSKGATIKTISYNVLAGLNKLNQDISALSNGVYFIRIIDGTSTTIEKFVKK